jgi:hypothetical protein
MKVKVLLDVKAFNSKPINTETGSIQNRIHNHLTELSIIELATKLKNGRSFKPAILNGKSDSNWIQQQIFALDFDNQEGKETTIQEQINYCTKLNLLPAFIYTTFSHTDYKHKFRMIFVMDKVINDLELRNKIQMTLLKLFDKADQVAFNTGRLFFGGNKIVYENYDSIINIDYILTTYFKEEYIIHNKNDGSSSKISIESEVCAGGKKTTQYKENQNIIKNSTNKDLVHREEKGNEHNNDFNYHNYLSPRNMIYSYKNAINALKNKDVEYLKNLYNHPKTSFETQDEFLNYIKEELDLSELLGIDNSKSFKCILHDDSNNSASIYKNKEGIYLYNCFSDNCKYSKKALNIVTLLEAICDFKSRYRTFKFIENIFNLELIETEFQKEHRKNLDNIQTSLNNAEFNEHCPQSNKNIRYVKDLFFKLIDIAKRNIYNEEYTDNEGNIIFFVSLLHLGLETNATFISKQKISQRLSVLIYHNLLKKLDDSEIPKRLLNKSQLFISRNCENRVNWYAIPSFVISHYFNVEKQGIKWFDYRYTIKGSSREMFFRNEGKEIADWIYPQHKYITDKSTGEIKDRTTSLISDKKTDIFENAIMKLINFKNYCTEKDILILFMNEYGCKEDNAKIQFKKVQAQLIKKYNLKCIKSNKKIKEFLNIGGLGYPYIYVKEDLNLDL